MAFGVLAAIALAQVGPAAPAAGNGPSASDLFYLTLLFIFLTAVITTLATKWAKDKCLKLFHRYHVTVERSRGQATWGTLKVFSSGIEVVYDHAYPDHRGRQKTSFLLYQQELDTQLLSIFRYEGELDERTKRARLKQVHRTFNPGPFRRLWRGVRNLINTLRDAFNAAIGAAVGQIKQMNVAGTVLNSQGSQVTQIGQTLLSRFANAYEPLLEQYIGQPVILQVADPINSNNESSEYTGYLADYTQQFIAVFNVAHAPTETHTVTLPDLDQGEYQPPLPPPPPPGAARIVLPPAVKEEHWIAVRMDGRRMLVYNTHYTPVVIRRFEREGFEPVALGLTLPPNGWLELPARDVRGGTLTVEVLSAIDIVAPRKFATVRHAGELVERRGFVDELHLSRLPLVPKLMGNVSEREPSSQPPAEAVGTSEEDD